MLTSIEYAAGELRLLDQRLLPGRVAWVSCRDSAETAGAIRAMVVRGAPAIAIAAAYGMALAQRRGEDLDAARARIGEARPTAVNLRWALERLRGEPDLEAAARRLHDEQLAVDRALGEHGADLLSGGVLTICNTGALATGAYGTALGMVRTAWARRRDVHVWACETRPYLQGARLTAFECAQAGIPCTVIPDGAVSALLATGRVRAAVAGCDRVARNGDTANKIGTYDLAVACKHFGVPLYIAMPRSSLDLSCPDGGAIPIELRPAEELLAVPIEGVDGWNPAFDVTPASLISAWVSERGVERAPF
ncbi:MAG: S-methyl-5-thioribose-1-phosphate isomerase [Myxococcota bacterium]